VYPVGTPPEKVTVPAVLEKVGSVVHKLKIDDAREADTTDNSRGLKDKVPSAAFTGTPAVFTNTFIVKVAPVLYTPVPGETASVAACVVLGRNTNMSTVARQNINNCIVLVVKVVMLWIIR
jgi:hypothetical protein